MSARAGVAQLKKSGHRRQPNWQERAACGSANPNIFHDPDRYAVALLVCQPCPVKAECLANRHRSDGVWGGKAFYPKRKATV